MFAVGLLYVLVFMHLYDSGAAELDKRIPKRIMLEIKKSEPDFKIYKVEQAKPFFFDAMYLLNVLMKKKGPKVKLNGKKACYVIFQLNQKLKVTKDPYIIFKYCKFIITPEDK